MRTEIVQQFESLWIHVCISSLRLSNLVTAFLLCFDLFCYFELHFYSFDSIKMAWNYNEMKTSLEKCVFAIVWEHSFKMQRCLCAAVVSLCAVFSLSWLLSWNSIAFMCIVYVQSTNTVRERLIQPLHISHSRTHPWNACTNTCWGIICISFISAWVHNPFYTKPRKLKIS